LQISHGGQYKCQAGFRSLTAETETSLIVNIPTPTVSVTTADDRTYAGSNLTLVCTITLDRVLVGANLSVNIIWTGPHGERLLDNGRITVTDANKDADDAYSSTVVFTPLHVMDNGGYSCGASVNHTSEFISSSDLVTDPVRINVKVITVIMVNPDSTRGTVVAGNLVSISCMITDVDSLEVTISYTLTAQRNNASILTTSNDYIVHNFTARVSDAGIYICEVTITSPLLDEPIMSSETAALTIQIPAPELTIIRDPDLSVTLRHGDPLSLTCIIQLDPAVDIDVTVVGTLSGQGIQDSGGTVEHDRSRSGEYQIKKTIATLTASKYVYYTCNVTVSPVREVMYVEHGRRTVSQLNVTVGKFLNCLTLYHVGLQTWDLISACVYRTFTSQAVLLLAQLVIPYNLYCHYHQFFFRVCHVLLIAWRMFSAKCNQD
jgi:hypothetical protein